MSYRLTLAEIESSVRKAARGCGLDWGLAEEAGKAARWLAAYNLPGPESALAQLQELAAKDYRAFMPQNSTSPWQASGGLLCPIITGAALADHSAQMLDAKVFTLGPTAFPLLLAASVGQAARRHRTVFTTAWGEVQISCFENGLSIDGNHDDLLLARVDTVSCRQDDLSRPQQPPSTLAYAIDEATVKGIDELTCKIYAPATEASRAGAGAGLTDND
ncbi:MAG: DUF3726 domain-containing protein [Halieaceae bacterium]|nr:DUF3726 domain-containing protein [Halieaceae bacterium]